MTCQFEDNKMIDIHCKIKIWNDEFEDTYCQTGCPLKQLKGDRMTKKKRFRWRPWQLI